MNQTKDIKKKITELIDMGVDNKHEIYSLVVTQLKVPRPTVRRAARELRQEWERKIAILKEEIVIPSVA